MYCPKCKSENIGIKDSRSNFKKPLFDNYRRRRYICHDCGNRFSSIEFPVDIRKIQIIEMDDTVTITFKKLGE